MGRSDPQLFPFYKRFIDPVGDIALLGFTDNRMFLGDLYDIQLGNWEINSEWTLRKKYDTIICLRCAYFSKDPKEFLRRCSDNLNDDDGIIYVDWGLGDHWRFKNYKIGWVKDSEHEFAYKDDNFLWSCFWDESLEHEKSVMIFKRNIEKFGYFGKLYEHIIDEVPSILSFSDIRTMFSDVKFDIITLWEDLPQLYILLRLKV